MFSSNLILSKGILKWILLHYSNGVVRVWLIQVDWQKLIYVSGTPKSINIINSWKLLFWLKNYNIDLVEVPCAPLSNLYSFFSGVNHPEFYVFYHVCKLGYLLGYLVERVLFKILKFYEVRFANIDIKLLFFISKSKSPVHVALMRITQIRT